MKQSMKLTVKTLLLLVWGLLSAGLGFAQDNSSFLVVTDQFPPYSYLHKGHLTGVAVDIVSELIHRTGYPGKIVVRPWERVLKHAGEQQKMLFPFTRRPYREKQYKWIGPILDDRFVVSVPASDTKIYQTMADVRTLRIGVVRSTPTEARLRMLEFPHIQPVSAEMLNAKKLIVGQRIDAWYSSWLIMKHTIRMAELDERKIRIAVDDANVHMYIGASLGIPDEIVNRWQHHFDDMRADGTYARILKKNSIEWNEPLRLPHP